MNIDSEPESRLPWAVGKYLPRITGEDQLEQVHRYLIARGYAKDKDVLDIACGEGFGSAILAKIGRSVIGVNFAAEATKHAAVRYPLDNLKFRKGSCTEIPLVNDSIDLVVSFETIEHHDAHKAMMAEIKRVLRPGGLVIISSSVRNGSSSLANKRNPFQVGNLSREEFKELLTAYFKNVELMSQRIVYGSGILPEAGAIGVIGYDIKNTNLPHRRLARSRYLIAFASDEALPDSLGGFLEQSIEESEIVKRYAVVSTQFANKARQLEEQLHYQSSQSEDKVRQLEAQVLHLNLALDIATRSARNMRSSFSWKMTWPLRFLRDAGAAILGKMRLAGILSSGDSHDQVTPAIAVADTFTFPLTGIKPAISTVLILIHEASRTGAPILGWNIARTLSSQANVVAVLMKGGPLEEAFAEIAAAVVRPVGNDAFDEAEGSKLARRLVEIYRPSYVIANSVATRALVQGFADDGVAVIALVHEFSSRTSPGSLRLLYETAAEIVFPAEIVRRASEADYPFLRLRNTHVLPQGVSKVPASSAPTSNQKQADSESALRIKLRPERAKEDLIVVGMGYIEWRKGIDLFIATATTIFAREPEAPLRFIWVGGGYRGPLAMEVSSYLAEQITRSRLGDRFDLMDAVEDVEGIYKEADVLFLSSRLDPLPNVAIDATVRGIPVVCFAEASGMAEILTSNHDTRELVVPHLDTGAAATLIGSLAAEPDKLRRLGDAVRAVARSRFDMSAYVTALQDLGRRAREAAEQKEADVALILATGSFDAPLYLGGRDPVIRLDAAVREYSSIASKYNYARAPDMYQAFTRRPLAGFHPITYALQNPNYDAQAGRDPLAHYLSAGRPKGSWEHPVFRIQATKARPLATANSAAYRVVLHGHFYYTDHVSDFMRALAANEETCELILTTNSTEKADEIRATLAKSGVEADIRVLPNRGRDIGPFLTVLEEKMGRCDLLGHIHGKRSLQFDRDVGDRWRIFLWQHLIGDETPMLDIIQKEFIADPTLGLVFPEDPYLVGWDKNLEIAEQLAARMGLSAPLPTSIECPVGTMFWARPEALAPLLRFGFGWDEYPPEPLPADGTILHAIERLLPIVVEQAGYRYATTYLPKFVR
jgi:ubiquinone/menaquinone biosynthesis C-methylase UbiE